MSDPGLLLGVIARVPPAGVAAFQAYEDQVLPLLADHGGRLQRRVRNQDGTMEIHLVWFPSEAAFDGFRADPRRAALASLLGDSGAVTEVTRLIDI